MKSVAAGAVLLASLMAAPAFAADLPVKARPYQQPIFAPSWTGLYIGGQVGYANADWGNSPLFADLPFNTPFAAGVPVGGASGDGVTGGGHVGYNYQMSNWVFGIETDFNWTAAKNNSFTNITVGPGLAFSTTRDLEYYGTVRGRLGYAAWANTLLYVTGGWAYGKSNSTIAGVGFIGGPFVTSASNTHSGWTVGVGVDYMIAANWIVGAEYKHIDLGSETYTYVFPILGGTPVTGTSDLTIDEVTARVAYKF
jgi:outer membrane immunogenic protein